MTNDAGLISRCAPAVDARTIRKAGHITPSSNTTAEPLTTLLGLLAGGALSHHFARVSVQRLALDAQSRGQFRLEPMLAAARLLGEAPLDVIAWNGTAGSWLGRDHDTAIVKAIEAETGVPATTTTLAMFEIYRRYGWTKIGVVCPYVDDVSAAIATEYGRCGLTVVASANLGLESNHDMGNVSAAAIRKQLVDVARAKPDCIAVICTNVSAIPLTAAFEAEFGIPIVDSIAATFVEVTRLAGVDARIAGFGQLLAGGGALL